MNKTKRIAESPEFVRLEKSIKGSINSGPRDPAEANVTARLFKSNPVQNALPEILTDIRTLLGIDETSTKKQPQKKADKEATEKDESPEESTNELERKQHDEPSKSAKDGKSKEEYLNDVNMDDVSDDESMDLSYFDARLASASDSSDSEDDEQNFPIKPTSTSNKATYKIPDDMSISSSVEERSSIFEYSEPKSASESESPPPPPALPKSNPSTKDVSKDKPKDTTFLPSLMMGGYWSGSESEPEEDDEVAAAATGSKPQRKNRMGQQARRALWEKKFGARAKHIQEEQQKKGRNNKNSGWDARRGATDDKDKPRWATGANKRPYTGSSKDSGEKEVRKENAIAANKKKAYDGLHPSWEAARKAKQEKAQASFQGKKITFD